MDGTVSPCLLTSYAPERFRDKRVIDGDQQSACGNPGALREKHDDNGCRKISIDEMLQGGQFDPRRFALVLGRLYLNEELRKIVLPVQRPVLAPQGFAFEQEIPA